MTTKKIKEKGSLFICSNSINVSDYLASGTILPESCSRLKKDPDDNFYKDQDSIYLFQSFSSLQSGAYEIYRKKNSVPVVIEVSDEIVKYFNPNTKLKKINENDQSFYLTPFIPIYFIKSLCFRSDDDLKHFNDLKYSNIDNDLCDKRICEDFFQDGAPLIFTATEDPLIPLPKINTLDSMLGGIQALIHIAKDENSSLATKKYFTLIEDLINQNDSEISNNFFGFNILEVIENGPAGLNASDSVEIKLYKATVLKLVSQAYQDVNFSSDLIEDIVDIIPGSILSKDEEEEINNFLKYIDGIASGSTPIKENIFKGNGEHSIIRTCLLLLMTQIGRREFLDIIDLYKKDLVSEEIYSASIFLFGLFRNYSSLDLSLKSSSDMKNISLLCSPLLAKYTNNKKLQNKLIKSPSTTSKWLELSFENKSIASIDMDDPFYTSIIAQAAEAGYKFIDKADEEYVYTPFDKNKPHLKIQKVTNNFFRIQTKPLLKIKDKKLTKNLLLEILIKAGDKSFRSSVSIENNLLILKSDQLSDTLDIPEISSMIKNLISDYISINEIIN